MKHLKGIFTCAFVLSTMSVYAVGAVTIPCINTISTNFQSDVERGIQNIVDSNHIPVDKLDDSYINKSGISQEFYKLFAEVIEKSCTKGLSDEQQFTNFNLIADEDTIIVPFEFKNQKYDIQIDTIKLFDYLKPVSGSGILIADESHKNLPVYSVIDRSSMPKNYYFSSGCSDHSVTISLSDSAAVNVAGKAAFGDHVDGKKAEYFIDLPPRIKTRAFPGLITVAGTNWGSAENTLIFFNYKVARDAFKSFSDKLQGTACRNQNLAVYHVQLGPTDWTLNSDWMRFLGAGFGWAMPQKLGAIQYVTTLSHSELIR